MGFGGAAVGERLRGERLSLRITQRHNPPPLPHAPASPPPYCNGLQRAAEGGQNQQRSEACTTFTHASGSSTLRADKTCPANRVAALPARPPTATAEDSRLFEGRRGEHGRGSFFASIAPLAAVPVDLVRLKQRRHSRAVAPLGLPRPRIASLLCCGRVATAPLGAARTPCKGRRHGRRLTDGARQGSCSCTCGTLAPNVRWLGG